MYSFDPAINYGPNDAGVSAISILLVALVVLIGSLIIGTVYGFVANLITGRDEEDKID